MKPLLLASLLLLAGCGSVSQAPYKPATSKLPSSPGWWHAKSTESEVCDRSACAPGYLVTTPDGKEAAVSASLQPSVKGWLCQVEGIKHGEGEC